MARFAPDYGSSIPGENGAPTAGQLLKQAKALARANTTHCAILRHQFKRGEPPAFVELWTAQLTIQKLIAQAFKAARTAGRPIR